MKSKNIPVDIRAKSVKDAQNEIFELIDQLENIDTNLEDSTEQYNRILHLNNHIHEEFKKKANEIKKTEIDKNGKVFIKN